MKADALGGQEFGRELLQPFQQQPKAKYSSVPVDNSTGNFVKVQQPYSCKN